LNLACLSTHPSKKQLLSYTKSIHGTIHIHQAYDAANQLIGQIKPDTLGTVKRREKKSKDDTLVKSIEKNPPPVVGKQFNDDDVNNNDNNQINNPDYHQLSSFSTTTEDELEEGDKKPRAKKIPPHKKTKTNDKHKDGRIHDAPTDIITIPEIVDLMIKSVDEKSFVIALQDVGKQITTTKGKKKVLENGEFLKAYMNRIPPAAIQNESGYDSAGEVDKKTMPLTTLTLLMIPFLNLKRKWKHVWKNQTRNDPFYTPLLPMLEMSFRKHFYLISSRQLLLIRHWRKKTIKTQNWMCC
jgi:hypothetical protein